METFLRAFYPSTIKLWNSLANEIRNQATLGLFKKALVLKYQKVKRLWFNAGSRFANIHHARMRIGCSMLKAHLFYNLFVEDNPFCKCGHTCEDPQHFFFDCRLYAQQRTDLYTSLTFHLPLTLDTLLYGDDNLSVDTNIEIVLSVQDFITKTG